MVNIDVGGEHFLHYIASGREEHTKEVWFEYIMLTYVNVRRILMHDCLGT